MFSDINKTFELNDGNSIYVGKYIGLDIDNKPSYHVKIYYKNNEIIETDLNDYNIFLFFYMRNLETPSFIKKYDDILTTNK
jgi:hypothetical protein